MANNISSAPMLGMLVNSTIPRSCTGTYLSLQCHLLDFGHTFAYFLLAVSLLPQVTRLLKHQHLYVAGISYMWIILRILALSTLLLAHTMRWSTILELCALGVTMIIFFQIVIFSNNLHRQNKIILVVTFALIWILGRLLIFFFIRKASMLSTIGYILIGVQMLPQILLNSLLRTAKALSKFSMILLAMSDVLLFASFPVNRTPTVQLIAVYYSFSFVLFVLLQSLVYNDDHIHLISRSAHTVLTPGVDLYTGLDANGPRSSGQDPQLFPTDEFDQMDGIDVIYQPVTTTKSSRSVTAHTGMQKCLWYTILACLFSIETAATIILIYRVSSPWVIFVPLSIFVILGIFYYLRTRFSDTSSETMRKIL